MAGKKNNFLKNSAGQKRGFFLSALILFFAISFSTAAFAQFSVLIQIQNQTGYLVQNEVAPVEIKVINLGVRRETGIRLFIETTNDLALVEDGLVASKQEIIIPELFPNQAQTQTVFVKAIGKPTANAVLSISYGTATFSNLAAQTIEIRPAPVRLALNQNSFFLSESKPQSVFASFFNDQNSTITQLQIRLMAPQTIDITSKPFYQNQVLPFSSVQNVELEFWPKPLSTGNHELTVIASYTDATGFHQTEQRFQVRYEQDATTPGFLLLAVVILLGMFLVWNHLKSTTTTTITKTETKTVTKK